MEGEKSVLKAETGNESWEREGEREKRMAIKQVVG